MSILAEENWEKKYSNFPGVKKCIELIASPNVKRGHLEFICNLLEKNLKDHLPEFFDQLAGESQLRVRLILWGILDRATLPECLSYLEYFLNTHLEEEEKDYIKSTLKKIGTKESRKMLWKMDSEKN